MKIYKIGSFLHAPKEPNLIGIIVDYGTQSYGPNYGRDTYETIWFNYDSDNSQGRRNPEFDIEYIPYLFADVHRWIKQEEVIIDEPIE